MAKRKKKKNTFRAILRMLCLLICIVLLTLMAPMVISLLASINDESVSIPEIEVPVENEDWALLLVNYDHPLPSDYSFEILTLSNNEEVDERIYPALQSMFDDARNEGINLFVRSGYRDREEQEIVFQNKLNECLNEGMSEEEAYQETLRWVAEPGKSEHETGLAVDINSEVSAEDTYNWLIRNSYKYGFVQRYADEKSDITKVYNEPWHYRYVGKNAAYEMVEKNFCLEEYLENKS
ncbi:MAG: M15 family metallopeptidase [Solobacterium sp.]|nr:M15 family metallopeptidase [Solobacterium sp.]